MGTGTNVIIVRFGLSLVYFIADSVDLYPLRSGFRNFRTGICLKF